MERIFTKQHVFEAEPERVSPVRMDRGLRDPGVGVNFAGSRQLLVGMDLHHNVVLRRD